MPEISHATVYNTLDALVKCGLARQVQLERGATRFCPNMDEHCHYYCDECGDVFDVPLQRNSTSCRDQKVSKWIITTSPFTAICADCAKKEMTI